MPGKQRHSTHPSSDEHDQTKCILKPWPQASRLIADILTNEKVSRHQSGKLNSRDLHSGGSHLTPPPPSRMTRPLPVGAPTRDRGTERLWAIREEDGTDLDETHCNDGADYEHDVTIVQAPKACTSTQHAPTIWHLVSSGGARMTHPSTSYQRGLELAVDELAYRDPGSATARSAGQRERYASLLTPSTDNSDGAHQRQACDVDCDGTGRAHTPTEPL